VAGDLERSEHESGAQAIESATKRRGSQSIQSESGRSKRTNQITKPWFVKAEPDHVLRPKATYPRFNRPLLHFALELVKLKILPLMENGMTHSRGDCSVAGNS
jgi:hypothetical protein